MTMAWACGMKPLLPLIFSHTTYRETLARHSRGLQTVYNGLQQPISSCCTKLKRDHICIFAHGNSTSALTALTSRVYRFPPAKIVKCCNPRETLARHSRLEQGNRGTGEQVNSSSGFSHENPRPTKRADVQEILDYLDQHLREADLPIPNRTKHNQSAARLLIDKDGHSVQEIKAAIDWTFRDEFWRTNIRSASKLREKWGQLKGAAQRQAAKQQRASSMPLSRSDQLYIAEMQRLKTEEQTQSLQLERGYQ